MFYTEENELDTLRAALTHTQSWIELHTAQRQNLLNFFLIAVAFLFSAYVGALAAHRYVLAGIIGLLGATISVGFTAMDLRNRDLTRAGEIAMKDLEGYLADRTNISSLRILEAIDQPRHPWLSIGKIIRSIHVIVGIVFFGTAIYAFVL
jgi:hypothetical protein